VTQEHLAQAAGIDTRDGAASRSRARTHRRIPAGHRGCAGRLARRAPHGIASGLAGAWGVSIEEVTDELVQRKLKEAKAALAAEYSKIALTRVANSG